MNETELKVTTEATESSQQVSGKNIPASQKLQWETPRLEDVSEEVMAQPYIRFT